MIALPYQFDTLRYMRLPIYGILLSMLGPLIESLYVILTTQSFVLTAFLSAVLRSVIGILIGAFIVHYVLKLTNPARGSLSRHQAVIETFAPFGLGHSIPAGTYALEAFSNLKILRVEPRHKRTIGKPSAVYAIQLEWTGAKYRPLMLQISTKADFPETVRELAHELNLPLKDHSHDPS